MAYFNFQLGSSKGLNPRDIILLQLIKQNKMDKELSPFIAMMVEDEVLDILEQEGIVEYIKGNKKQTQFEKIRLSSKGLSLLEDLETPEILEEDLKIYDWISAIYTKEGKEIGNRKKTKMYIALFRVNSSIQKNSLAFLIQHFINEPTNMEHSHRLEYLFHKPATAFQTRFDIEESRLYKYYLNKKEYFDQKFEKL